MILSEMRRESSCRLNNPSKTKRLVLLLLQNQVDNELMDIGH